MYENILFYLQSSESNGKTCLQRLVRKVKPVFICMQLI